MIHQVQKIPPDSIILLQIFNRDISGKVITHEEFAELVSSQTNVPVFGNSELMLNHGILGGKITTGFDHGVKAGELATRVLNGEPAGSIPIVRFSPNRNIFDYTLLSKHQIPETSLPPESEIINNPAQTNVPIWVLCITVVIIVLCSIIILILLYHLQVRKKTESDLRKNISERIIAEDNLKRDELRLESLIHLHQYPGHCIQEIKNILFSYRNF